MIHLKFITHQLAEHAVKNWHYSKTMPSGKTVKVGVYEDDSFRGVIIFSMGANNRIGQPFNLTQQECCELTRVAMRSHKYPVTKAVAIAIRMLKKVNPDLKLIVSCADLDQNHEGVIYKAGNWLSLGKTAVGSGGIIIKGKLMHLKSIYSKWGRGSQRIAWIRENLDPEAEVFKGKGKYKFVYLLTKDKELKSIVDKLVV